MYNIDVRITHKSQTYNKRLFILDKREDIQPRLMVWVGIINEQTANKFYQVNETLFIDKKNITNLDFIITEE